MQIVRYYKAIDGKCFNSMDECRFYESNYYFNGLFKVDFYTEDGLEYHIDLYTLFSKESLYGIKKVIIHNEMELRALQRWAENLHFKSFYAFNIPGVWIWQTQPDFLMPHWELEKAYY